MMREGPAARYTMCPGCHFSIVLKENTKRVDDGRRAYGTITSVVRCPNPRRDSRDSWVEEKNMHKFRVPKEISDLGHFDQSEISKLRVVPVIPAA
jgi:hypothetical protein